MPLLHLSKPVTLGVSLVLSLALGLVARGFWRTERPLGQTRTVGPQLAISPSRTPDLAVELPLATVGAHLAQLTIAEIKPYWEGSSLSLDNISLRFAGPLRVGGQAYAFNGDLCFDHLDEPSLARLPYVSGGVQKAYFCFRNSAFALTALPPGRATILIDQYTINSYPNGADWNEADLVTVLQNRIE